jgi:hypothetical protein
MGIIRTEVVRMDRQEVRYRIEKIEKQIEGLPKGSIGTKSGANGRTYYYHRYMENGKRVEKYVAFEDVAVMQEQIAQRKTLEMELKALKKEIGEPKKIKAKMQRIVESYFREKRFQKVLFSSNLSPTFHNKATPLRSREVFKEFLKLMPTSLFPIVGQTHKISHER